jgi:hypothetical protein
MVAPSPEERRERIRRGSRRRRDLEGAAVTEAERAIAAAALAAINAAAGTVYTLSAHLAMIVGRVFEHPELSADDHRAIVAAVFRAPWWTGIPGPQVIYGNAAQFERSIEMWRNPAPPTGKGTKDGRLEADLDAYAAEQDRLRAIEQSETEEAP